MLDFRPKEGSSGGFSRSERRRIALLVFLLGTVIWLMVEARKPENYRWLWVMFEQSAVTDSSDTGAPSNESLPDELSAPTANQALSQSPTDNRSPTTTPQNAAPVADAAVGELQTALAEVDLSQVSDDTPFRADEAEPWFRIFALLRQADEAELSPAKYPHVQFATLFRQSEQYRGRPVALRGDIMAASEMPAPKNDIGIDRYYRLILRPENEDDPVVLYVLELPKSFPVAPRLTEPAEVVGVYFKRWVYLAGDGLRSAPVVLAKTIHWSPRPAAQSAEGPPPVGLIALISGIASVLIAYLIYLKTRPSRPPQSLSGRRQPHDKSPSSAQTESNGSVRSIIILMLCTTTIGLANVALGQEDASLPPDTRTDTAKGEKAPTVAGVPASTIDSARQFFELYGVSTSLWERVEHGVPLSDSEKELLYLVLYHGRKIQPIEAFRWNRGPFDAQQIDRPVQELQGQLFTVEADIESWERVPVLAEIQERFGLSEIFLCRGRDDTTGVAVEIYTERIPAAWKSKDWKPEGRLKTSAFFLKWGNRPPQKKAIFAARRVGWLRNDLLGRLGVDASLFDDLLPARKPTSAAERLAWHHLGMKDRECFYTLLAAVRKAPPGMLNRLALEELTPIQRRSTPVEPLFNRPLQQRGKLVRLEGTARRVERVDVTSPDIRERFDIDHYYTIYLFTEDSQNYPLAVCVPSIPEDLPLGEGAGYHQHVSVAGFFMKTWAFQPAGVLDTDSEAAPWQLAPLIIGTDVQRYSPMSSLEGTNWLLIFPGLLLLLVFVVWLAVWWFNRQDARRRTSQSAASAPTIDPGASRDETSRPDDTVEP
ncbi:hypothetical protein JCM19992_13810 [Thermostilla marina]